MQAFPSDLTAAISAGDCVLWTGAGIGALVAQPGWSAFLSEQIREAEAKSELEALMQAGERLTVLDWVRRTRGVDVIDAAFAAELPANLDLPEPALALGRIPWHLCLATAYPDLLERARVATGGARPKTARAPRGIPSGEASLVLHCSPSKDLRNDHDLRELVEEIVRTRTLILLGFELGDPDLRQILTILRKVPTGGRQPLLFLPEVGEVAAASMSERFGVAVSSLPAGGLAELTVSLAAAVEPGHSSKAAARVPALDLGADAPTGPAAGRHRRRRGARRRSPRGRSPRRRPARGARVAALHEICSGSGVFGWRAPRPTRTTATRSAGRRAHARPSPKS